MRSRPHLEAVYGDSAMGWVGLIGLAVVGLIILLVRAPGPGGIVPDPVPEPIAASIPATTTASTSSTSTSSTSSTTVATTTTSTPPTRTTVAAPAPVRSATTVDWDYLADCESGEWDANRVPIRGTARWNDQSGGYEGGVHFAPSTWDGAKPVGYPDGAHQATREQQIVVAEIVLDQQGPGAWPVCSRKVGMR